MKIHKVHKIYKDFSHEFVSDSYDDKKDRLYEDRLRRDQLASDVTQVFINFELLLEYLENMNFDHPINVLPKNRIEDIEYMMKEYLQEVDSPITELSNKFFDNIKEVGKQ